MAVTEESLRRTNEVPGTRAVLKNLRTSAYKVREVLNLIRGRSIAEARDILRFTERGSAEPVLKLLNSAVANAEHNDELNVDELVVAACFADEGTTMKRFRPRARGRASRIRKRGAHITIIVARMDDEQLARLEAQRATQGGGRSSRVANSRANRVARSQTAAPVAAEQDPAVEAESSAAIAEHAPEESNTSVADAVPEPTDTTTTDADDAQEEKK